MTALFSVYGFLDWFGSSRGTDPVLRAGLAHSWFLTVHPFEDGDSRVSRAIADMALAQAEGTGLRFYSMSSQIEARKDQHREVLGRTQKGSHDATRWLVWFLNCLDKAIVGAEASLSRILQKASAWERVNAPPQVSDRQKTALNAPLDGDNPDLSMLGYARLTL